MARDHHHHNNRHPHGPGHNHGPRGAAQWQTPHLPADHEPENHDHTREPDLDLVEKAFAEGFGAASDPTSFLRLAGVPFAGHDSEGRRLMLLRVETRETADLGSVTPHLGGGSFRYAPLPARLVSRRRHLAFVYYDGAEIVRLTLAEARALTDDTPAR